LHLSNPQSFTTIAETNTIAPITETNTIASFTTI
jgi:hypothetical protein